MIARPDPRFATEPACCAYLVRRLRHGKVCCRKCGQPCGGKWLARNHSWQCAGCGAQTGIRCGSVMAHSALPLCTWFHAIKLQLLRPSISIAEMSNVLAIRRRPTVVAMRKRIRQALESNEATQLLVGLDQAYLPCDS
jgi:hypothetical protein